jgi:hypothetical protein
MTRINLRRRFKLRGLNKTCLGARCPTSVSGHGSVSTQRVGARVGGLRESEPLAASRGPALRAAEPQPVLQ